MYPIINIPELLFNKNEPSFTISNYEKDHIRGRQTVSIYKYDNTYLAECYYYDKYLRLIQTIAINTVNGYDFNSNSYIGLSKSVFKNEHHHYSKNFQIDMFERYTYSYDNNSRLIARDYSLNNASVNRIEFNYNELSKLTNKRIYVNGSLTQNINYAYNERGWISKINNPNLIGLSGDFYGIEYFYNTVSPNIDNKPMYSGLISGMLWNNVKPNTVSNYDEKPKGYKYCYDNYKRYKEAFFFETVNNSISLTKKYDERLSYDPNGNISQLKRRGLKLPNLVQGDIDNLHYYYKEGNLIGIDDSITISNNFDFLDNGQYYISSSVDEYSYDRNGNMKKDLNKMLINVDYNSNNLPTSIQLIGSNKLVNSYDTKGTKKQQITYTSGVVTNVTVISDNIIFENGYPSYILFDEGRAIITRTGSILYEFFLKDNLGKIIVTYSLNGTQKEIRQVTNYYPTGLPIKELSRSKTVDDGISINKYQLNSKLSITDLGLGFVNFGSRTYYPQIGRFITQDKFAEKYFDISSYSFCANNPIAFIDINGDSLDIASKYRDEFNEILKTVFGENANKFSYNSTGKLVTNAKREDFTKQQRKAFDALSKLMNQKKEVKVIYEFKATIPKGSKFETAEPLMAGGGITASDYGEHNNTDYLIIAPINTTFKTLIYSPKAVRTMGKEDTNDISWHSYDGNLITNTWHEIGEASSTPAQSIDIENVARKALGMEPRQYDKSHCPWEDRQTSSQ